MLVALALLWIVVLVPTWTRNRQYRAAEKHTAHIQRTLRMIAETTELPEEHVVEANAKNALQHQKMLKELRHQEAVAEKIEREKQRAAQRLTEYELKRELAMQKSQLRSAKLSHPRLKPVRLLAATATLFGLIGLLVGAGMAIGGLGPAVLIGALAALTLGLATLVVLAPGKQAAPAPATSAPATVAAPAQPLIDFTEPETAPDTSHQRYLEQQARARAQRERARAMSQARQQQTRAPEVDRVNLTDSILLREDVSAPGASASVSAGPAPAAAAGASAPAAAPAPAAASASAERPAARDPRPVLDVEAKSQRLAAQERLRAMGVVGDTAEGAPNIADALRRRRNVG